MVRPRTSDGGTHGSLLSMLDVGGGVEVLNDRFGKVRRQDRGLFDRCLCETDDYRKGCLMARQESSSSTCGGDGGQPWWSVDGRLVVHMM